MKMPDGIRRGLMGAGICALVVLGLWAQQPAPILNTITPDFANTGSPDLTVALQGANFFQSAAGAGDPVVFWFGPGGFTNSALITTFIDANNLTAVIPASHLAVPGLASMFVQNPDFQTSSSVGFQIFSPTPVIATLTPDRVAPGSADFFLTIDGSNFFDSIFGLESSLTVLWNGTPMFPETVTSTQITLPVPAALVATPQLVNIQVQNPDGPTSAPAILEVSNPLTITTTSLPPGDPCSSYLGTLTASEGIPPYTWSVTSGGDPLPSGLTLDPDTGLISGFPSVSGSFTVFFTVQDAAGRTATVSFVIDIGPPLAITTTSLPDAREGVSYAQSLSATGGISQYTWSIVSGELPPGLGLDGNVISGTPTTPGLYSFTVEAQSGSLPCVAQQGLTILVVAQISIVTEPPLPPGNLCSSYSLQLEATGGAGTLTWSVVGGALPPGLTLSPEGLISGVPGEPGTYVFTARAADSQEFEASREFTLEIGATLSITTTSLSNARQDVEYSQTLLAAGGTGEFSWSIVSGELPPGLSLEGDTIAGIPTAAGVYNFTVEAQSGDVPCSVQQALSIEVIAAIGIITDPLLPPANLCSSYSVQLEATGGLSSGLVWSVVGGALPTGLTLSPAGLLDGIPQESGTFVFTASAADSEEFEARREFTLEVGPSDLEITTTELPEGMVGRRYNSRLTGTGGTGTHVWSIESGELPPGLTLDSNGRITGTPTEPGAFLFTAALGIEGLPCTVTQSFRVTILTELVIDLGEGVPPAFLCSRYVHALQATGGTPPYSWSVGSGLPEGIRINQLGSLVGTPVETGEYVFRATVSDSSGNSAVEEITLVVGDTNFIITTESPLPEASTGVEYSLQFEATGGTPPLVWSASGDLPAGLQLSPQGLLTGIPVELGTFTFALNIASAIETCGATKQFELTITAGGPVLSAISPASTLANSAPLTVTLTGVNFDDGAVAQWNGPGGTADLATTFVSDTELTAAVPLNLLAIPGTANISVVNPDGLASGSLPFSIIGPSLTLLNPGESPAGGPGLTVQATGEGFGQGATTTWTSGGTTTELSTTVLSETSLEFAVPETLLGAPETAQIAIVNPDGSRSQSVPFAVQAPSVTLLDPGTLVAESEGFPLAVTGANFIPTSIVRWNGPSGALDLATTFVGPSTLQADVAAELLAAPGPAQISVANNAASVSNELTFTISPIAPPPITVTPSDPPLLTDPAEVSVTLAEPAATDYTCRVSLTFEPHPSLVLPEGFRNEALVFLSSGTTESECTIERGQTAAVLPEGGAFQRGTVAGTITAQLLEIRQGDVAADIEQQPGLVEVPLTPPVITLGSVRFTNVTSSGFNVELTGYSTTRELISATLTFRPASGAQLGGSTSFNVPLSEAAVAWFESEEGLQLGASFRLSIPFTFSGSASAIGGVDATLTNSIGTSTSVSGGPPTQ